ncbi:MAG: glycerate kinase type-2 family protein [Minisyncoccia bacterium]
MTSKKIKNFEKLAQNKLRSDALLIAEAGLEAIDTSNIVSKFIQLENNILTINHHQFNILNFNKIVVCAIGKCALEGAKALENILGDFITDGIALYVGEKNIELKKIEKIRGTHPYPSEINVNASKKIIKKLSNLTEKDLVIFLISGGGSTLLCLPTKSDFSLETEIFKILTRQGANILELNTLRKHISLVRGGFLAKYIYPAKAISLIFSDVLNNNLSFISSGPTVKDETTIEDAKKIIEKYQLQNFLNLSEIELIETPKEDFYFENILNILAVSNEDALKAMENKAKELQYNVKIIDKNISGEAREVGIKILNDLRTEPNNTVLLYGGETTVTVKGHGRGGRNLELALACAFNILENEIVVPFDSDGKDNGDFAGAIADLITKNLVLENIAEAKIYFENNDEYPLFEKIGNYLLTGDTGSNVSDLIIAIKQ